MRGFSKAIIAGNVTRDPELRTTTSGSQVCSFSIAVNRSYRGNDGTQQDQVSFIECVAWGKPGETIAQYVKKGSGLLVSGRLEQRSWDDKTSGQRRSRTEVVIDDFTFIGGGNAPAGGSSAPRSTGVAANDEVVPEDVPEEDQINLDDIPF